MQMKKVKRIKKELENKTALVQCAKEFNVVGDPTRLKICYLLCRHKELAVGDIAEVVGVSVSAISHSLKKLREADVVENRRECRRVYYKLRHSPLSGLLKEKLGTI